MSTTTIRFATIDDVPVIHRFIRELAEYEKLVHEVVADEDLLQETLFSDPAFAEVLIAESGSTPAGFALFFHNYSTFLARPGIWLEDLYVSPDLRGQGIGKALLCRLAAIAVERGCGRLEWSVLDWNRSAIKFYRSLSAESLDGWTTFRLTGDDLVRVGEMD